MSKWIEGISNEAYHLEQRLGSGRLKEAARLTGAKYKMSMDNEQERKYIFDRGSVLHMAVLEPVLFASMARIAILPDKKRPTVAQINAKKPAQASIDLIEFWEDWDRMHGHKYHIKQVDYDKVIAMKRALIANPLAHDLLFEMPGRNELTGHFEMAGLDCHIRPDRLLDNGDIIDLKGSADASPFGFKRAGFGKGYGYGYQLQGAYYLDGANEIGPRLNRQFIWVVVEWDEPHDIAVYSLGNSMYAEGRQEYVLGLYNHNKYAADNYYPSYADCIMEIEREE